MTRRLYKHKLLLDEGFPPRYYFPNLNQRFDVKHIKNDLKKIGLPDYEVYEIAIKLKRLIVTYNTKDFKQLASKSKEAGVIGVSPLMPYYQIDNKLISLLTKSTKNTLKGKYTSLKSIKTRDTAKNLLAKVKKAEDLLANEKITLPYDLSKNIDHYLWDK